MICYLKWFVTLVSLLYYTSAPPLENLACENFEQKITVTVIRNQPELRVTVIRYRNGIPLNSYTRFSMAPKKLRTRNPTNVNTTVNPLSQQLYQQRGSSSFQPQLTQYCDAQYHGARTGQIARYLHTEMYRVHPERTDWKQRKHQCGDITTRRDCSRVL